MTDRDELLEAAFDSVPEGIALLSAESEVVLWNQAAQGITGYAAWTCWRGRCPMAWKRSCWSETRMGMRRSDRRRKMAGMHW